MMENRRSSSLLKWCVYIQTMLSLFLRSLIFTKFFFFFTHVCRQEKMYSNWFCDGDVLEAQAQMLSKRGDALLMDWTQLRLGYRLGMCTILAMWVAWDSTWGQIALGQVSIGGRSAFPVFRACFGLLSWHWFWGMSVYVWTRYRINYIYLFEFDPRNVDTPMDIFNDAVDETLVFLICMLMYYKVRPMVADWTV